MLADPTSRPEVEFLSGLEPVAARYDLVLCDIWGVVHNGIVAYSGAAEALTRFRRGGGLVMLLSNAPRPGAQVAPQLDRLGFPRTAFDGIVTSGDLTRAAVVARRSEVVHHLGPERDRPLFDDLRLSFGEIASAAYVVCTGLIDDDVETVADYRERLAAMRGRDLLMLCANPDIVVERGDRLVPCAGALAAEYAAMGGAVNYTGKPHRPVYEAALAVASRIAGAPITPARTLAIGDAIRTDILGAERFGIDSLLVARGIHAAELGVAGGGALDPALARTWLERQEARPRAVMDVLVWR